MSNFHPGGCVNGEHPMFTLYIYIYIHPFSETFSYGEIYR